MAIKTVKITKFDGGMTNDPQDTHENVARVTKHVDNYTLPHSLKTHPDNSFDPITDPNTAANLDTWAIKKFLYPNGSFYGLGVSSSTVPAIYKKATIGVAWALGETAGAYASLTALAAGMNQQFIYYQSYLYGLDGGGWWKYGNVDTGTEASDGWTRQVDATETGGTANLNCCQPIVHSKDDIMYVGGGSGTLTSNILSKNNSGTWSRALTFSTYTKINSICEYGNYLAIGTTSRNDTNYVYLWDRDASLTTLSEKIDWGSGTIKWIQNIGGTLIGCSVIQASGLGTTFTMSFKYYNGSSVTEIAQFTCDSGATPVVYNDTQIFNNVVYFMAEMTIDGESMNGIWRVVKHNDGHLSVSFDRLPRIDDTVVTGTLYGFLRTGDYFHIGTKNIQDSNKHIVTKTLSTYTTTAKYQTPKYNGGDISQTKKLLAVSVMTEPMNSTGSVILKYKADSETSYTTIFTNINITAGSFVVGKKYTITSVETTDFTIIGASANTVGVVFTATGVGTGTGKATASPIRKTAINIESSGANLPQFKQIQFSVEPSNATVTGIKFTYEEINDDAI